jgi:hypothetical protein
MKISAVDFMRRRNFSDLKAPALHGHVEVKLYHAKSGNLAEKVEGDNIISNALADIFAANLLGGINYSSQMPIWSKWYGGILCYEHAHTLDPDNYFMQGDDVNGVIAHAGNQAPGTAVIVQQDLKRGSPVDISHTANSVTQTWEWLSEQGNCAADQDISAISLCHVDVGNAGTGSAADAFRNNFEPFETLGTLSNISVALDTANNLFCQYDANHGLWFHIGDVNDFYSGHTTFSTNKLTIIKRRLPYSKIGLYETLSANTTYEEKFVVELSNNLFVQPAWFFDFENKKLWIFNNVTSVMTSSFSYMNDKVNYAVIDVENQTVESEGIIESDVSDLAPLTMMQQQVSGFKDMFRNANVIKDGNYIYLPVTDGVDWGSVGYPTRDFGQNVKGFQVININNQSDQSRIVFDSVQKNFRCSMKNGGIMLTQGKVVNGDAGWECKNSILYNASGSFMGTWTFSDPLNPSSYVVPIGAGGSAQSLSRFVLANKMLNTTLYNLGTPVHKTTAKSMQISYTLTEV